MQKFSKNLEAPQSFRRQNGASGQVAYWGPKILGPTVQYKDASASLCTPVFALKGLTKFLF